MPETLVLIPGLLNDERLYGPQIEALSADRAIIVADQTRDDTISAMAERLLREAPERFALAGLSMGGYIAMEVLRQAPERVARLALLDTTARPDTDEASRDRRRLIGLAQAGRFGEIPALLWPRLVSPRRLDDLDLKEAILPMMAEAGPEVFIRQQYAIIGRPDSRDMLSSVEIPTLILVGEDDAITPPEVAREMADRVEWASLVVIPETGHMSSLERPEQVSEALRRWLEAD
jgi:pimeloyl-ACP methyl ester carboxylesterase